MRIVILGCGRVGAALADLMAREGHDITIIDQNSEAFARLGQDVNAHIQTVIGDGIDEDVLREAGLEAADAFAAVTNGDNRNIMAAQIAKHRFQVPKVTCRIYDPIRQETYTSLGLDSISPTVVGANLFREELLKAAPASPAVGASPASDPRGARPPHRDAERGAEREDGRAESAAARTRPR